jgi:3-carboxy-cis,cis-muconate cycloisomerase
MRRNLEATGGLILAERVSFRLAEELGRPDAQALVTELATRAARESRPFRDALLAEPRVTELLSPAEIDALLDPAGYLGSAELFVDRALDLYRRERP